MWMRAFLAAFSPFSVFDDAGVVAEDGFQLRVGLLAQFVAVAEEQGGLWQAFGFVQPPEQIGGDDGLAGAGGEGEQHAGGLTFGLALDDFLECGTDGGVLVVAGFGIGRAVRLEK